MFVLSLASFLSPVARAAIPEPSGTYTVNSGTLGNATLQCETKRTYLIAIAQPNAYLFIDTQCLDRGNKVSFTITYSHSLGTDCCGIYEYFYDPDAPPDSGSGGAGGGGGKNGGDCPPGAVAVATGRRGNPCDAATGNKYESDTDYAGATPALGFVRSYNSQLQGDLDAGFGWSALSLKRLAVNDTAVTLIEANGRSEPFTCPATTGACTGDPDTHLALTKDGLGYTLNRRGGRAERYSLGGLLLSETDANGQITRYSSYNAANQVTSVTDPFGRVMTYSYVASHIASVTTPNAETYTYTYDTANNLTDVTYPDGSGRRYHYENASFPHHLTGISNLEPNGTATRYATFTYDANGKAATSEHAGAIGHYSFTYDSDTQTTATDAIGTAEVMTFAENLGLKTLTHITNQADGKTLDQLFDAQNNLTCKKDEEGRVTTYTYNATNQKTAMTEGLTGSCAAPASTSATRTLTYQYLASTLDLPTVITAPSVHPGSAKTVAITYADSAHPNLPTNLTQSGFTPSGGAVARSVAITYTALGQVATIDGPRTDVTDITTFTYYTCTSGGACGQLQSVTDPLGHVTTYGNYDANGRLTQMTDPNGVAMNYTYDPRGRMIAMTVIPPVGNPRTSTYTYNAAGNLTSATFPDGLTLAYSYDAAQLLRAITDTLGNKITYAYDLKGNRTQTLTLDPDGTLVRSIDTAYDIRNRVSQINQGGSITNEIIDAVGNLLQESDPNQVAAGSGLHTTHQYDALNRLIQTVNNLSGVTTYGYDIADRLTQVQAPNNATTQYPYDDLGNLLQETSPDRGSTTYTYDDAGNVKTMTDARGVQVLYTYDPLNRLTAIDYPGTQEDVVFTYDSGTNPACTFGIGRLCQVIDESGVTTYTYDPFGNVQTDTHTELGHTYTTRYTYDARDRRLTETYPSGRLVSYGRDPLGRITGVNATVNGTNKPIVSNRTYRADGRITRQTFGNGFQETRAYDLKGQLVSQTLPALSAAASPVAAVVLAPDQPSPQAAGTPITFTAQASGGSGNYEYRFTLNGPATANVPQIVQAYSASNTFTWATTNADLGGDTTLTVDARNAGSAAASEAAASTTFTIEQAPLPPGGLNPVITDFGTISATATSELRYTIDVPAGASNLTITLRGGTGDADLYVKYGSPPTPEDNDCHSINGGPDGQSETCILLATEGRWHILVRAYSDIDDVILEARYTTGDNNLITNQSPVPGHSAPAGAQWVYAIDVPPESANFKVTLTGGSGDADLYVRYGNIPAPGASDCYSINGGADGQTEACVLTATPGRWYILLKAYSDIENVTLTASYSAFSETLLTNGETRSGLTGGLRSEIRYAIDVPATANTLTVNLTAGSGDADLYVNFGSPATQSAHVCVSSAGGDGDNETCTLTPSAGRYYILIRAYTDIADYAISAAYTESGASLGPEGSSPIRTSDRTVLAVHDKAGLTYWVKAEKTTPPWLAVKEGSPYLPTHPARLAEIDPSNPNAATLWVHDPSAPLNYRAIEQATLTPVALSANPNPAGADTTTYSYDANGNLITRQTASITDQFTYDPLDRLTLDHYGTLTPGSFSYDPNGNRTERAFEGFTEDATYTPNTNRLTQTGNQTVTLDPAGHTLSTGTSTYSYNNAGRLTTVQTESATTTYLYNAQGQRTRKITPEGTTLYHYDTEGNLIEETTATGEPLKDYVYADGIPIAQIDTTATDDMTYLHSDHLGTPRIGTDANRTVVWYWRSLAFGSMEPVSDPDADGTSTTINLRMTGQYWDAESQLHYNWNRYYDPRTGRYLTSDPIGLLGGLNTYAYVFNNPLRWIDPIGWAAFCKHIFENEWRTKARGWKIISYKQQESRRMIDAILDAASSTALPGPGFSIPFLLPVWQDTELQELFKVEYIVCYDDCGKQIYKKPAGDTIGTATGTYRELFHGTPIEDYNPVPVAPGFENPNMFTRWGVR